MVEPAWAVYRRRLAGATSMESPDGWALVGGMAGM